MSRNRLTGDALTTAILPTAAGGTYNEGLTDDVLCVPASFAAGVHTVTLNGAISGQPVPGDGDQIEICDPLGQLAPGTSLVITGKISSLGAQIADQGTLANSITLNQPGAYRLLTYSNPMGCWVAEGRNDNDAAVVIADAATTTIQVTQGRWRTLTATQANAITLGTTGALPSDQIEITRLDTTAFAVTVINGGAGVGTLTTFVASKLNAGLFQFDGTNWALRRPGQT